jgi:hypothetical protein
MRLPAFAEHFLYQTNKVVGVEFILLDSGFRINCCICEKKDSKIAISFSKESVESIEDLLTALPESNLPVALVFNGKGVIHKKISTSANETPQSVFHKVFATGNEAEFYSQVYFGANNSGFASVMRKDKANEIIKALEAKGNKVIDFFLGPFAIENVLALQGRGTSVHTQEWAQHKIEVEDGQIKEYSFNPAGQVSYEADLNGNVVGGLLLSSFSAALNYFIPVARINNNNSLIKDNYEEYRNAKAFRRLMVTSLVLLFTICLVNFLLFNSYFNKQKNLNDELGMREGAISSYEKLNKVYLDKVALLERSGLAVNSRSSFISDRLLYDLPENILLNTLAVYPVKNAIEKDSVIEFESKKVIAKGLCDKSIVLNNWINLLKTKDFIEEVTLNNYEQDSEKDNGRFDLTIRLK